MARRHRLTQTGWYYAQGDVNLASWSITAQSETQPVIAFDDIEGEVGTAITRERSEWYFDRIVMWLWPYWAPNAATDLTHERVGFVRLGQLDDDFDLTSINVSPSMHADAYGRIYQEEWFIYGRPADFAFNGAELVSGPNEAADFIGSPGWLGPQYKWDLSVKTRIQEGASLVLQVGGSDEAFASTGDTFGCTYALKALLRRKQ